MEEKRYCPKCGIEMEVVRTETYNTYTGEEQKVHKCEEHGIQYIP